MLERDLAHAGRRDARQAAFAVHRRHELARVGRRHLDAEANEIVYVLESGGIKAVKEREEGGRVVVYKVAVPGGDAHDARKVTESPEFKAQLWALYRQLDACADQLLAACSTYVGEPEGRMPAATAYGDTILRVIHYPPVPADRHPQSVRAAAHEDINLITLLCEATSSGLELLQRDGRWRPIHAIEGQIIVDSGDMLQQWTNGLFKSTTHRVVNPDNSRERRFSMPFFVHPRPEVDLTPLPRCVARTGGEVRFPSLTAGQYLARRLKEIGLDAEA